MPKFGFLKPNLNKRIANAVFHLETINPINLEATKQSLDIKCCIILCVQ